MPGFLAFARPRQARGDRSRRRSRTPALSQVSGIARRQRCGDLVQEVGCGAGGVGGLGDGAADDDAGGSGADGVGGGGSALLVAEGVGGRADAGDDEDRRGAVLCAEGGDFEWGADEAGGACIECHGREMGDLVCWGGGDAGGGEFCRVHAGEDGDGEEGEGLVGCVGGFDGGTDHGGAAAGVKSEQIGTGAGGDADGGCDSVGDVVKLEVEKDALTAGAELVDDGCAFREVELEADLVPEDLVR